MHLLSASGAAVFLEYPCAPHGDCCVPEEGGNGADSVLPSQVCLHLNSSLHCWAPHGQQKMQGISSLKASTTTEAAPVGDDSSRQKRQEEQHKQKEQFLLGAGLSISSVIPLYTFSAKSIE